MCSLEVYFIFHRGRLQQDAPSSGSLFIPAGLRLSLPPFTDKPHNKHQARRHSSSSTDRRSLPKQAFNPEAGDSPSPMCKVQRTNPEQTFSSSYNASKDQWKPQWHETNDRDKNRTTKALNRNIVIGNTVPKLGQDLHAKSKQSDYLLKLKVHILR